MSIQTLRDAIKDLETLQSISKYDKVVAKDLDFISAIKLMHEMPSKRVISFDDQVSHGYSSYNVLNKRTEELYGYTRTSKNVWCMQVEDKNKVVDATIVISEIVENKWKVIEVHKDFDETILID